MRGVGKSCQEKTAEGIASYLHVRCVIRVFLASVGRKPSMGIATGVAVVGMVKVKGKVGRKVLLAGVVKSCL